MIEKEKQITVERLIKVGRLASPFEKERDEENALNIDDLKLPLLPGEAGYDMRFKIKRNENTMPSKNNLLVKRDRKPIMSGKHITVNKALFKVGGEIIYFIRKSILFHLSSKFQDVD